MGAGTSVQGAEGHTAEDICEGTLLDGAEAERLTVMLNSDVDIVNLIQPMPILARAVDWIIANQNTRDEEDDSVPNFTVENLVYLVDVLHPRQSIRNKREFAWSLFDVDCDDLITHPDLVTVYKYLFPLLPVIQHEVLAHRALLDFDSNKVTREEFEQLMPDSAIQTMFTRIVV